jgi:hypothetical protein
MITRVQHVSHPAAEQEDMSMAGVRLRWVRRLQGPGLPQPDGSFAVLQIRYAIRRGGNDPQWTGWRDVQLRVETEE